MRDAIGVLCVVHCVGFALTATAFVGFVIWDRRCNGGDWTILTTLSRVMLLTVFWPLAIPMPFIAMREHKREHRKQDS